MVADGRIDNRIGGRRVAAASGDTFDKFAPATGALLFRVARSRDADVAAAMSAALTAQPAWGDRPGVQRGLVLQAICRRLQDQREAVADIVAAETGTSRRRAEAETDAACQVGFFFAGEGQRLYGRTTTSAVHGKWAMTVREPLGVAALIVAANTPIANVAWKVFPALICGNAVVLKAAEDAPGTADIFAELAQDAGLPAGLLNVVHGLGDEAGQPLVTHPDVAVVSFTGSSAVGRRIATDCGGRLKRVSLELGGKNPFVVCDDADPELAVNWAVQSAFSNAGQRCASGSRLIVCAPIYDAFRARLLERTSSLRVGSEDEDDLGPVMNERHLGKLLDACEQARNAGVNIIAGGHRLTDERRRSGYYLAPTILEGSAPDDDLSTRELFGPIVSLYRVPDFEAALAMANQSPYGLTACIHTRNIHRALEFTRRVQSGVAVVNAGTFGSEPHMPFGGVKQSGNGSREPGTEALDVYSNLKDIYLQVNASDV